MKRKIPWPLERYATEQRKEAIPTIFRGRAKIYNEHLVQKNNEIRAPHGYRHSPAPILLGQGSVMVVAVLTLSRIIKSVVTGQAPVTLELRNTPEKKHKQTKGGTRIVYITADASHASTRNI